MQVDTHAGSIEFSNVCVLQLYSVAKDRASAVTSKEFTIVCVL